MKRQAALISKWFKAVSLAVMVLCAAISFPAQAQTNVLTEFRKGEVVVELEPGVSIDDINAQYFTTTIKRLFGTNFYLLGTKKGKKEKKWRKKLAKDSRVLSAALNPVVTNPLNVFGRAVIDFPGDRPTPGQALDGYLNQLNMLNLRDAQLRSRGEGVTVAIIDTGVDHMHPALQSHMWTDGRDLADNLIDEDGDGLVDDTRGWDFIDNDSDPSESGADPQNNITGHGTFIAGLISLIAPAAKILPVRAFASDGLSDAFTVASAIKYATDHGAQVINLSFGSSENSDMMLDAVLYARQRGAVLVAAVGNANESTDLRPQFPAGWKDDAIGVAAIDSADRKALFSNYGLGVAVSAPGVDLISAFPGGEGGDYARWSGTSFAAPLASAEAALILAAEPGHPNARGVIENTASNIDDANPGFAGRMGRGRIDPLAALQSLVAVTNIHAETTLASTGVEPSAQGKAEISIIGAEQEFEVEVSGLTARASYKVIVDGRVVIDGNSDARAVTSNFGSFKVEFSTTPSSNDLPLPAELDPVSNIRHVEIRNRDDLIVLQNDFGTGAGGTGQFVEKKANLASTGVLPDANGEARVEVEPEREELRVKADNLTPGAVYSIWVDGNNIGAATAQSTSSKGGYLEVEFSSDGTGDQPLPQAVRPVTSIQHVELRDQTGQVVLQGDFQAGGGNIGGGDDNGGEDDNGGGDDNGGDEIRKEVDMVPTGVDPNAEGRVRARTRGTRDDLDIDAKKLDPIAPYMIFVDGHFLGTFTTDSTGEMELDWSSVDAGDMPLPPEIRPVINIRRVEIRDQSGTVVLSADLPG